MRRKKHKQTRRAVNFYRINYGFHEPYKVLLDGNFIHATSQTNQSDLTEHLPKLLGGRCKLYVTSCVLRELRTLGKDFAATAAAAGSYQPHKCGHKGEHKPAAECLREQIGSKNGDHWFVATQDKALRQTLAKVPACPCIFATVNGLQLEAPSVMTKDTAEQVGEQHLAVPKHELKSEALQGLEELRPKQHSSVRFRRNKAKGPNPLSVKKKIKKPERPANAAAQQGGASSGDGEKKRKRTRVRKSSGPSMADGE